MIFYRLEYLPSEDNGEGEDWDVWFTSLTKAKKYRTKLIKERGKETLCKHYGENLAIYKMSLDSNLSHKKQLLNALNKTHLVELCCVAPPIKN